MLLVSRLHCSATGPSFNGDRIKAVLRDSNLYFQLSSRPIYSVRTSNQKDRHEQYATLKRSVQPNMNGLTYSTLSVLIDGELMEDDPYDTDYIPELDLTGDNEDDDMVIYMDEDDLADEMDQADDMETLCDNYKTLDIQSNRC